MISETERKALALILKVNIGNLLTAEERDDAYEIVEELEGKEESKEEDCCEMPEKFAISKR